MPNGHYQLEIRSLWKVTSRDSIEVSGPGLVIEAEQQAARFAELCEFQQEQEREPALALLRVDTVRVERQLPDGRVVRHTLIVAGVDDEIRFTSVIQNVGSQPAPLMSLCHPFADASVLRNPVVTSLACYGSSLTLAPGGTFTVHTGGALRGAPGVYHFRIHPVDPALLDIELDLPLAKFRQR